MNQLQNTCPEYEQLKAQAMRGWKTWNVHSVFSFVHMPDGLSVNLSLKEYRNGCFLKDALIGRFPTEDWEDATEVLHPLEHAMDDSYTAIKVNWCDAELLLESASDEDRLYLKVTPVKSQKKPLLLVIHAGYMWNRPGIVYRDGDCLYAEGADKERYVISCSAREEKDDLNIPLQLPYRGALCDSSVYFAVLKNPSGTLPSPEELWQSAACFIEEKKQRLREHYASCGTLDWMVQAMECAISYYSFTITAIAIC